MPALLAAATALGVIVALWAVLGDLRGSLDVPPESTPHAHGADLRPAAARGRPVRTRPDRLGAGGLRAARRRGRDPAARVRVPRPVRWKGPIPAALIVSVPSRADDARRPPGLAVLSILLGLVLCALYVATGSLLPGIALASAGSAVALGFACALAPAAIAGLALGCALVSVALGAIAAREGLGAVRRPLLRGSAA